MEKSIFQTVLAMIDDFTTEQKEALKKALDKKDFLVKVGFILDNRVLANL